MKIDPNLFMRRAKSTNSETQGVEEIALSELRTINIRPKSRIGQKPISTLGPIQTKNNSNKSIKPT